jgi:hypothetical protein
VEPVQEVEREGHEDDADDEGVEAHRGTLRRS